MVNEDGKIQLIDFGVAGIVMTSMEEDKRKTVIGTPHWMAPELQWEKAEIPHGFEVDIWAYGITLYECAMGQPPHANITNPRQLRQLIRKNPIRLAGDSFTPELCDLIQFLLEPDVEKRPTMEQICQHPYVLGTEVQYPTENLQELVQQYCRWESQGGIRHSLWMAGGAEKVENMQSLESQDYDDGWDFSAPNTFRNRMSQIDPSFASYDAFSPMDSGQTYLSSSPPMDDDYFGSRYTTTIEVTDEKSRNSNLRYRSASPEYLQESGKAFRGAKTLGKIFDPRGPGYQYNFGKMSDLPLRQGQGGEASLHRQELSVSSNHGKVPAINLEDVSNKKRATMAWTWNEGLNAGAPVESSNRDSDFFADLPTSRQANPRQSDFFGDLAPNSRQGLDQAGAMPVGADLSDHRASTLDLDALLGPSTSYVLPVRSAPNGFTDLPSTNTTGHSDFPFSASNNRSQHTSYGGTTVASLGEDLMEEPLDAFETEMAAAATESANFTMRPSTYAEPVVRSGHTTTTSQLPTDLVSSPAGSSFDDVARDLPPITSQFPPSFHQPQSPGMTSGLNEWQPASRSPPWMGNEIISGVSNISVAPLPNRENNPQLGGTGPPLPYETQCKVGMKPIFGYPEAFDDRASPEIMEGGLKFHIKQTIDMFDYLTVQLETAYDEEMAQLERMHNQHRQHHSSPTGKEAAAEESDDYEDDDADEDEDEYEDEDAGYEGGQEEYLYHVEDGDEYARAEGDMSSHSA